MCGIFGIKGNFDHYTLIFDALKRLEYRGYDSSGIAYKNQEIVIEKVPSSIDELKKKVNKFVTNLSIGHTRWATHGKINMENTHPFISNGNLFCLAHNGTIDNYLEIKDELLKNSYYFHGETDSEVIVNYLEYLYKQKNNILKSIYLLDKKLKGSYSLLIISQIDDNLYFLKNQTSLLISKEKSGFLISSDLYAFNKKRLSYYELEDHQYGFVSQNEIKIYLNQKSVKVKYKKSSINYEDLSSINCFLEKEIFECPKVIDNLISNYVKNNKIILPKDMIERLNRAKTIYVIGCGTSFHAGLILKRLIRDKNIEVILASEFIYDEIKFNQDDVFILLSQSGETLDVIKAYELIKDYFVIGITNNKESRIARSVNVHLDIMVNKEISVASTKAYFGEVVILELISRKMANEKLDDIKLLPKYLNSTLERKEEALIMAKEISKYPSLYFLGKGIDHDIALECSLKLKEITYIHSEAVYLGELKHGPLSLVNKNFPSIIVSTQKDLDKVIETSKSEIISRGGKIFELEVKDDYPLNYLLVVLFGDLLSLYVGRLLNVNIDKPRNLAKSVTVE